MKTIKQFLAENPEIQIVYNEMRDSENLMHKKFEPLDNYVNSDVMNLLVYNNESFKRGVFDLMENLVYLEFIDLAKYDGDRRNLRNQADAFINELKVLLETNYEEK